MSFHRRERVSGGGRGSISLAVHHDDQRLSTGPQREAIRIKRPESPIRVWCLQEIFRGQENAITERKTVLFEPFAAQRAPLPKSRFYDEITFSLRALRPLRCYRARSCGSSIVHLPVYFHSEIALEHGPLSLSVPCIPDGGSRSTSPRAARTIPANTLEKSTPALWLPVPLSGDPLPWLTVPSKPDSPAPVPPSGCWGGEGGM